MSGGVTALIGAQFGSEGKGLIAGHIGAQYSAHVRVGAANAGHTLYTSHLNGSGVEHQKHVLQQIPCGAYSAPHADLYVGPGAMISQEILEQELMQNVLWRDTRGLEDPRVYIDYRAHIVTPDEIELEQQSGLAERIGSTSTIAREGIGAAQAARVMRSAECLTAEEGFKPREHWSGLGITLCDVSHALYAIGQRGKTATERRVLLEGTQGSGLSLTTGMFPYVTSRDTNVAGLCADAGVAPSRVDRVILVARTYPIRVAGPSGPFYSGSEEITWEAIGVDPESERTTVTKKVRRVATFSLAQVTEAVRLNGATEIALTFADYVDRDLYGESGTIRRSDLEATALRRLVDDIESWTGVRVTMLGTGPHSVLEVVR